MATDIGRISVGDIQAAQDNEREIVTIDEARLLVLAAEINVIEEQTKATVLAAACEIGKRLTEVKNGLPRGRFLEWVAENTSCSERSAQNMMALWEKYGKYPDERALADLSVSQAVALLAAPEEVRRELIDSGEAADMSVRELQAEIKRQKEEIKGRQMRIGELETELEFAQNDAINRQDQAILAEKAQKRAENERDEAIRESKRAIEEKNDAIRRQEYAERQLGETEQALAEARKAERVEIIETTPPEIEKELARLKELELHAPNEGVIVVRSAFDYFKQAFNVLMDAMDKLKEADAATYRPAFAMGIRRMLAKLEG